MPNVIARLETLDALRSQIRAWRAAGETIVLVPTMGALHEGHLALVTEAGRLGRRVVVSIFVNPTQFGPTEDFSRYPRTLAADLAALSGSCVDAVWLPSAEIMYPQGFVTRIEVGALADDLCGAFRPGHFSGVATVVTKLLNQVGPDIALFGEKDYQQLRVIQRVVADLDLAVEIRGLPTIREADGLALSSRNRYLDAAERRAAPCLHAVLSRIASGLVAGDRVAALIAEGRAELRQAGFEPIQYLEVRDAQTLAPVIALDSPARVLAAAYLGSTRLIDNIPAIPRA